MLNVSRWDNPPSRGRIRDTSNSRKIHFGGGFASLLKVTIESHRTKVAAKDAGECRRAIIVAKTRGLPVFLLFTVCMYVLSDNSIILKTCTPRWRDCKIACK